jgi:hypothetical protein
VVHIRDRVNYQMGLVAEDLCVGGWSYKKSSFTFSRNLCKGLTLCFQPVWSYKQAVIALTQPVFFISSEKVDRVFHSVFNNKDRGRFSRKFSQELLFADGRQSRQFVEFEVNYFRVENGYYDADGIAEFTKDLISISQAYVENKFRITSEEDFIYSLPKNFSDRSILWGWGAHGFGLFLLIKLMLGDEEQYQFWRSHFLKNARDDELAIINRLDICDHESLRIVNSL